MTEHTNSIATELTAESIPKVAARLMFFRGNGVMRDHNYWRVVECPYCGSRYHESGNGKNDTPEKARRLLGSPVETECPKRTRGQSKRYYILVEESPQATGAAPAAGGSLGTSEAAHATGATPVVQDGATRRRAVRRPMTSRPGR